MMVEVEITDDIRNELANNCTAACKGITLVIIKNTKPIVNAGEKEITTKNLSQLLL